MKEVSEDGSSSQKTVEKAQEDDVAGESPSAEKPEEAESADKEGEGSSSSNSTLQKKTGHVRGNSDRKTQIQTLKKRHHQRSPLKAMLPKGRSQRKLWGLMCQKG